MRFKSDTLRSFLKTLFLLSLFIAFIPPAHALEKASIQLKWLHHFQFAGYYAALEKGFYRETGLDVTIKEGGPTAEVEKDVATGLSDFGVGTSALLLDNAAGQNFVVIGQVFQHSPAVFLTPRKTGIRSVADMIGKRFMYSNQHGDMLALLKKYGINESDINKVPHQGDPYDLIRDKADVMLAYSFNEPYVMEQAGEPYFSFSPLTFGIDFYGDNFFTTLQFTEQHPDLVKKFRSATLRGWRYALEHKEEIAELILAQYSSKKSREWLLFEANQLESLIQPKLVELGYQNPTRWQRICDIFIDQGMLPSGFDPGSIIYRPRAEINYQPLVLVILISSLIIGALIWLTMTFRRLHKNLQKNIEIQSQTEEALRESEDRFRLLMETIPNVAVQGYSFDGKIQFWNFAAEQLYGYTIEEALKGNRNDLIIPPEVHCSVLAEMLQMEKSGKAARPSERLFKRKDGSCVPVLSSHALINPIGREPMIFSLDIDLTETKLAEQERQNFKMQILHTQKLESLGVLAGGIAHDFNNILAAIIGNVELGKKRLDPESPVIVNLQRIEQAADRAAELAKQMLAYSGKGKFIVENIDLNFLLEDMLHLLEISISKKAELQFNLQRPLDAIEVDTTQLRQIIMNLVINASEALSDNGGVISVTTGSMDWDPSDQKESGFDVNLLKGHYVYLEICDTGCGMDKKTIAKLFDPFFTTKFTGRGLGMSAVLGIVRGHQGAIKVDSETGKGTRFKLLLPASNRRVEALESKTEEELWQGVGKVMLVDDEETIRDVASDMLKELGFSVITATDGCDALTKAELHPDLVCVILDLTMPNMDGEQCFRKLKQLNPQLSVVMSSGYSEHDITQQFMGKGLSGFIQKPYKLSELKTALGKL